jgi:transcriptional regulator with GAF, ATPase, and Fis domain
MRSNALSIWSVACLWHRGLEALGEGYTVEVTGEHTVGVMIMNVPERRIAEAFVELADTRVAEFDLLEFLHRLCLRCVELLGADAAGLLLADAHDMLNVVIAASNEQARTIELLELQREEGACIDAYRTGQPVQCPDLTDAHQRWPTFADAASQAGFTYVHALPMRLREHTIGALNLFGTAPTHLGDDELAIAQALTDVATIGILHERASHRHEPLQHTLNGRITIEQAKGALAHRRNIPLAEAFTQLRTYARNHNRRLLDVATAVIERNPNIHDLLTPPPTTRQPPGVHTRPWRHGL